jgi:thymidine phosphorylase
VPSIPLITASILSKKLAEGIEALVLDVKFGSAAFMQTREQARELARTMAEIANESGVKTRALITDMNTPLGRTAGNWLEVKESVACLNGGGPDDLREMVVECAAHLLVLTGKSRDVDSARAHASQVLSSGAPCRKWDEMLRAQGADLDAFNKKLRRLNTADILVDVSCERDGFISSCDARAVGELVRELGGGRMTKTSPIDSDVGVDWLLPIGTQVNSRDVLCHVHVRTIAQADEATGRMRNAFEISSSPIATPSRVVEVL